MPALLYIETDRRRLFALNSNLFWQTTLKEFLKLFCELFFFHLSSVGWCLGPERTQDVEWMIVAVGASWLTTSVMRSGWLEAGWPIIFDAVWVILMNLFRSPTESTVRKQMEGRRRTRFITLGWCTWSTMCNVACLCVRVNPCLPLSVD